MAEVATSPVFLIFMRATVSQTHYLELFLLIRRQVKERAAYSDNSFEALLWNTKRKMKRGSVCFIKIKAVGGHQDKALEWFKSLFLCQHL